MLLNFLTRRKQKAERRNLFRNFIFGVEDSLVSTVGLLSGVTSANEGGSTIVTTGIILIFVEAFSMGVGSFLSEDNSEKSDHSPKSHAKIRKAALVMFFSYFFAGFIPLAPYVILAPSSAMPISILAALVTLATLGAYSAKHNKESVTRGVVEMVAIGGSATLIGVVVGTLLS